MIDIESEIASLTAGDRLTDKGVIAVEVQLMSKTVHNCALCDLERPWKVTDRLATINLGDTTTKAITLVCRDCGALQMVSLAGFLKTRRAWMERFNRSRAEDAGQAQNR